MREVVQNRFTRDNGGTARPYSRDAGDKSKTTGGG